MNKELLNLTNEIKFYLDKISDERIVIACRLDYIIETNLIKDSYADIYDYANKELKLHRKTINFYLDVVNRYCEKKIKDSYEKSVYGIKVPYCYFNFSQLKACLGLTDNEIKDLGIDENTSVHEIEKIKRNYKRVSNDKTPDLEIETGDQEILPQIDSLFDSVIDNKRNINIFKDNYIPDNSEYEIVFRNNDQSMIKSRKKQFNFNIALKHLRTLLENNSEENYYYAVVKIKKPL